MGLLVLVVVVEELTCEIVVESIEVGDKFHFEQMMMVESDKVDDRVYIHLN